MRGVFISNPKIGEAKYKVKMKRANCNSVARGGDPDYNARGGRAAAMDPSTAVVQRWGRGDGQGQGGHGRGSGHGWDEAATGGAAASSSSDWPAPYTERRMARPAPAGRRLERTTGPLATRAALALPLPDSTAAPSGVTRVVTRRRPLVAQVLTPRTARRGSTAPRGRRGATLSP